MALSIVSSYSYLCFPPDKNSDKVTHGNHCGAQGVLMTRGGAAGTSLPSSSPCLPGEHHPGGDFSVGIPASFDVYLSVRTHRIIQTLTQLSRGDTGLGARVPPAWAEELLWDWWEQPRSMFFTEGPSLVLHLALEGGSHLTLLLFGGITT